MKSYKPIKLGKALLFYGALGLATLKGLTGCATFNYTGDDDFQPNYGEQVSVVGSSDGYSGAIRKDNISLVVHSDEEDNLEGKLEATENHCNHSYQTFSVEGEVSGENGQVNESGKYKASFSKRLDNTFTNKNTGTAFLVKAGLLESYTATTTQGVSSSLDTATNSLGMSVGGIVITKDKGKLELDYTHLSKDTIFKTSILGSVVDTQEFNRKSNIATLDYESNTVNTVNELKKTWGVNVSYNWDEENIVKETVTGNLRGIVFLGDTTALGGSVIKNDKEYCGKLVLSTTSDSNLKAHKRVNDIRNLLVSNGNLSDIVNFSSTSYFKPKNLTANQNVHIFNMIYEKTCHLNRLSICGETIFVGLDTGVDKANLKWGLNYGVTVTMNKASDSDTTYFVGFKGVK